MTSTSAVNPMRFYYSVVRVVPDPVRDEAVNVGIVITPADGPGGRMELISRPVARVRRIHRGYSFEALDRSLRDLAAALGTDTQAELGEPGRVVASHALLETTAARLNGQLQLTKPQAYLAASADDAMKKLFRRYVTQRTTDARRQSWLTRADLRDRIWRVVREWEEQDVKIEGDKLIQGRSASHPADFVVRNGRLKAAIYALATHPDDRNLSYFYRDSLPTIARDMGDEFTIVAVLPPIDQAAEPVERDFAEETKRLLHDTKSVKAITLDELSSVRELVADRLF